ncbi:TPA: YjeO family protein [Citrobacter farmeri]|uniref:YjeO family protein n=1 Tax=Citrobacter farmeri TaxID=67824 RepID=UPI00189C2AD2|nr:YjeO family protein [Citrobacter farmeri]EKU0080737.1 YjeO family protein [Citrobacter farmeri]MBJ9134733.1 YjeO family protein [Citrobacter farmeri]MBJ9162768.1 YjeO family protein [Citrobacter farmeri]MDB2170117.1 YjeO family protein [Citrobacter farmeri]MDZ7531620.1 YjeO family protein [Citrobacter farmeri]
MNWKVFTLGFIWFWLSIFWIVFCSVQDKEWWIGDGDIKNICDLMNYIENDDARDVGYFFSLPVFFPAIYAILIKKKRYWFIYVVTLAVTGYWLWQFVIRYHWCF